MNKKSFTPGPWEKQMLKEAYGDHHFAIDTSSEFVMSFIAPVGMSVEEAEANAHLIAASPTMYAYIKKQAEKGCEDAKKIISSIE